MDELMTLLFSDSEAQREHLLCELEDARISLKTVDGFDEIDRQLKANKHNISTIVCQIPQDVTVFERQLRKLKKREYAKYIPIIGILPENMEKPAISAQLFFHILPSPLHDKMLSHTIEAGKTDYKRYLALLNEVQSRTSAIGLITSGTFRLQDLKQAEAITTMLSLACPDPAAVALGLSELLVNAIEHGNLDISYHEKSRLLEQGSWDQEIHTRMAMEEYKHRYVDVEFKRDKRSIEITITDQGKGFDWRKFIKTDPAQQLGAKHGRGIAIAVAMGFNDLYYNDKGNQVRAVIHLQDE